MSKSKKVEKVLEEKVLKEEVDNKVVVENLHCPYKTFKTQRDISCLFVPNKCQNCNVKFKEDDNVYKLTKKDSEKKFICDKCASEKVL